jgi:hypothetical protein
MAKRFRCGRLMVTQDGKIKRLILKNGGGTRFCYWYPYNMTFGNVQYRLLRIFKLSKIRKITQNIFISHLLL